MFISPVQPENALLMLEVRLKAMEVTLEGMVTLVSPVQPENALRLMEVTLEGMVTLVRPVQPENI